MKHARIEFLDVLYGLNITFFIANSHDGTLVSVTLPVISLGDVSKESEDDATYNVQTIVSFNSFQCIYKNASRSN